MSKAIKITGFIIILLAVAVFIFTLSIDGIVKSEIEEMGSELLQTEVEVDDVDISLFGGRGNITGFEIENPEGFSDEPAFLFQQATMEVDLTSFFSDEIVIKELIIKKPVVFFEQQETNINLKTLNDNLEDASTSDSDKMLIINYLLIEDGVIKVSTSLDRERRTEVTMQSFELHDIGRGGKSTVKESLKQILEPVLEQAIEEAAKKGLFEQLENQIQDFLNQ